MAFSHGPPSTKIFTADGGDWIGIDAAIGIPVSIDGGPDRMPPIAFGIDDPQTRRVVDLFWDDDFMHGFKRDVLTEQARNGFLSLLCPFPFRFHDGTHLKRPL